MAGCIGIILRNSGMGDQKVDGNCGSIKAVVILRLYQRGGELCLTLMTFF